MAALVGAELGLRGETLRAHLTLEQVLLLVALHMRLEVVHGGELLAAATHRAAERPQLVVRLQMSLEFIGGGEGPAAAVQGALEGSSALAGSVCQQVHLKLMLFGEGKRALRLRAAVAEWARTRGHATALGRAYRLLAWLQGQALGWRVRRRQRLLGGQREDAVVEAHDQVLAAKGGCVREGRAGPGDGSRAARALLRAAGRSRAGARVSLSRPCSLGCDAARHFQQHQEGVAAIL